MNEWYEEEDDPTPFMEEVDVNEEDVRMFQVQSSVDIVPIDKPEGEQEASTSITRQPVGVCRRCHRSYYTPDGYKNHLKTHLFEEYFRESAPVEAVFLDHCREEAKKIFVDIARTHPGATLTNECIEMASFFLSNEEEANSFVDAISKQIWTCLPSPSSIPIVAFHSTFVKAMNTLQSSIEKRTTWKKCLSDNLSRDYSVSALEWFIGLVPLKLSLRAEAFVLKCIRIPHATYLDAIERDRVQDPKFCQSVYYVGGSCVKSLLRVGMRTSKDVIWIKVVTCIEDKFLKGPFPDGGVTAWTQAVDRGGLKHINESVWDFLMALSCILKDSEGDDGSVLHESVIAAVRDDPILLLWDEIIDGSLSDEESDFLLGKFCYYFVNTWGVGTAQRLKNQIAECARDKISFRSTLLPRKSK